ncbi:MAG: AI-2E family transporter [Actinomycetota bacterium]|nr:AI-2E family transporter [Actinomycetota bacterium]
MPDPGAVSRLSRPRGSSRLDLKAPGAATAGLPETATPERAAREASSADLLLDEQARRRAAGGDAEHPFGRRGPALDKDAPLRKGMSYTAGSLLVLIAAYALYSARSVLVLLLVAAFLAVGLNPAVSFLQRRGLGRGVAVALVLGCAVAFVGAFLAIVGPPLARQAAELVRELPGYAERLQSGNGPLAGLERRFDLAERLRAAASGGAVQQALGGVLGIGAAVLGTLVSTLTVLILTLYFLLNYEGIKNTLYRLAPRSRRARVGLIGDEVLHRTGGYVLGNLATSLVAGVSTAVFLSVLGVPYAVALGMFVAIVDLIPLVGATIGAVGVSVVAFFVSVPVGLIAIGYYVAYQQFENYVLVPRVMQRTVSVSPVTTIVAVLIGGSLLGVLGALLAIPVAAAVQLVLCEVYYPRQDSA